MNQFIEGQKVICISERFELVITTESDKSNIGKQPSTHPIKGAVYEIDEILGDFLNFKQFNIDGFMWFHYTRFAPVKAFSDVLNEFVSNHN